MQALFYFRDYTPPRSSNTMTSSPIWLLGKKYECSELYNENEESTIDKKKHLFPGFVDDFETRIWCTYRKDFSTIEGTYYTSDMGWGCMHRTAQMTLAQGFLHHYLGRNWRKKKDDLPQKYYEILQLFSDTPTAPYSIHNISLIGSKQQKTVGEWYGPSTVSQALKELVEQYQSDKFCIYVSDNGMIYTDEIKELCGDDNNWNRSLILLIPLRLGVDEIPTMYYDIISTLFKYPQSLGMAGGKPRSSLYFIGVQDDNLYYLDPHVVYSSVDTTNIPFSTSTYCTSYINNIKISAIDPSFAAAFYCRDYNDFQNFVNLTKQFHDDFNGEHLFAFEQNRDINDGSSDIDISWPDDAEDSIFYLTDSNELDVSRILEDFVIL